MTSRNDEKGEITDGCVQWLKSNHQGGEEINRMLLTDLK